MKRSLRRTMFVLIPATLAALTLGVPTSTSDIGLQSTNLSCNDGTNLNLALDATSLTALTSAVAAIGANPSGLSCGLSAASASSAASSSSSSSSQHDFAVGGGRLMTPCQLKNFGLSAHVDDGTTTQHVGGTFNLTLPATSTCGGGHLVSKVDCLQVSGSQADFTAKVTKSDGYFTSRFPANSELAVRALDMATDMLGWKGTGSSCSFQSPLLWDVVQGSISVHD